LINDLPVLPDRFIIEMRIGPRGVANLGIDTGPGMIIAFQDVTHFIRLTRPGVATNSTIFSANGAGEDSSSVGAFLNGPTLNSNVDEGANMRLICDYRQPGVGSDPGMRWWLDTIDGGLQFRASSAGWTPLGGGVSPATAWDAGWQTGGDTRNFGPQFLELGGGGGSGYMSDLQIVTYAPV
jgi:hypothetical protein